MEIVVVIAIAAVAVAAVVAPLLRSPGRIGAFDSAPAGTLSPALDEGDVEREIARYRAAFRAGTLCSRCSQANPEGSRYCFECGRRLRAATSAAR